MLRKPLRVLPGEPPGKPVPRPKGAPTPCWQCPKTEGAEVRDRAHAAEVEDRHARAYRHHLECRAVRAFPDDPLVRRNARVIRGVLDAEEAARLDRVAEGLALLGGLLRR